MVLSVNAGVKVNWDVGDRVNYKLANLQTFNPTGCQISAHQPPACNLLDKFLEVPLSGVLVSLGISIRTV